MISIENYVGENARYGQTVALVMHIGYRASTAGEESCSTDLKGNRQHCPHQTDQNVRFNYTNITT